MREKSKHIPMTEKLEKEYYISYQNHVPDSKFSSDTWMNVTISKPSTKI